MITLASVVKVAVCLAEAGVAVLVVMVELEHARYDGMPKLIKRAACFNRRLFCM